MSAAGRSTVARYNKKIVLKMAKALSFNIGVEHHRATLRYLAALAALADLRFLSRLSTSMMFPAMRKNKFRNSTQLEFRSRQHTYVVQWRMRESQHWLRTESAHTWSVVSHTL